MVKAGSKISAEAKAMALLSRKNSAKLLSYRETARRCKISKSTYAVTEKSSPKNNQTRRKEAGQEKLSTVEKRNVENVERELIRTTPFAVHYEKIRIHLRELSTNSAKIHSLARKSEHLRINQIQ